MYNWSTDLRQLSKNPVSARIWQLEQAINFGLNGEKLTKKDIKSNWHKLRLDPARKKFLKFLLWPQKS
jgi:GH43 family beta-xylosidase